MKKRYLFPFYFLLLASVAGAWAYKNRAHLIGIFLEPVIERALTPFFKMDVYVKGLRFDPVTGDVSFSRFTIMNPREFSRTPHIELRNVKGRVNVQELLHKKVLFDELELGRLDYLIERIMFDGDTRTNCRVMSWHIKDYKKAHPSRPPVPGVVEESWHIHLKKIWIRDGSFYYANRITKENDDLQFKQLHGHLFDFKYPSDDKILNQDVELKGMFGRIHSAPFRIWGKANFATSNVGFDLLGRIDEGPVQEYRRFWSGMGVRVKGGNFTLDVKGRYKDEYFESMNTLQLKTLKLSPGKTMVGKIWGSPGLAVIKFLESEQKIELQIPVHGDITDPAFEVSQAFRKAFQTSIKLHTKNSLEMLKDGTTKLATGATKASEKILEGVGAVTGMVTATTAELKQQVLPAAVELTKDKK